MKKLFLILLPLLLAPACIDRSSKPGGAKDGPPPTIESKGPDDAVLRVSTGGGFVPVEFNLAELPVLTLYGDGRVITTGPQIAIYPGPALPNLLVRKLTPEGIKALLEAARDAGLTGEDRNFDQAAGFVTDMPTTAFTLSTDQRDHVTSVYGFGYLNEVPGLDREVRDAVEGLQEFDAFLQDLEAGLPEGSVGKEEFFTPTQIRVHTTEKVAQEQPEELPQQPLAWPLAQPLSEFGDPSQPESYRCGVASGADAEQLLAAAQKANQLTPWTSGDKTYKLVIRPLLPDESGC